MNKKLIITAICIISSIFIWPFSPLISFYLICLSVGFGCFFVLKFTFLKKILISLLSFSITWISIVDYAFKDQADLLLRKLIYLSNSKKLPTENFISQQGTLVKTTPIFTKYAYKIKKDPPQFLSDIEFSYTDIWGRKFKYCDACGNYENK